MQNLPTSASTGVRTASLSLPKGGGAIQGMGEALNNAGPDGVASLSLPLPISTGRGYAPSLALSYSSGAGNGPFGLGWQCAAMSIRLRTAHGVPKYDGLDTFIGPDGEILLPALNANGTPDTRKTSVLMGAALGQIYSVTRYQPRVEDSFTKIECWTPATSSASVFWLVSTPDGQIHCLGKNAVARTSDPSAPEHIAEWWLEESVSPTGEHIYYQYQAEDDAGCDSSEKSMHAPAIAQRYLSKVYYGNVLPQSRLFVLDAALPAENAWLFTLLFDYGERDSTLSKAPSFDVSTAWPLRADSFSRYDYGFALRTRRLCRQILMFHRLQALAGENTVGEKPLLVSRTTLDYDQNAALTTLVAVRQSAYEANGTVQALPPLEFDYAPMALATGGNWQTMPVLAGFNGQQPYQFVDLYGEGLPGILYQDSNSWWYREPLRQTGGDLNAITYAAASRLPVIPTMRDNATLMDIDGDGRLEWLCTQAGVQGCYRIQPDRRWSAFTPLNAFPIEYHHPQAQLADLTGDGLSDLVLIGPKSVRMYANAQGGWSPASIVAQPAGVTLPGQDSDARQLIAFSDILGSGQQHWVTVSAAGVTCWPNLGHGNFGQPLTLAGFTQPRETFNPRRVYLADIDGTGADDILYLQNSAVVIYRNQSGNGFADPVTLPLPAGVHFDDTCLLQIADVQGTGTLSLILTVPHSQPQHWCYPLTPDKPGLLHAANNNMGAHHQLHYRSSAQFWLDEKAQASPPKASYLPFPLHLLWKSRLLDEVTGNEITHETRYLHGVWDGKEREFRGFAKLEQIDSDTLSTDTSLETTPPSSVHSWFATGLADVDDLLAAEFWRSDTQAFPDFIHRFTHFDATQAQDVAFTPATDDERYWLNRALRGKLLRTELYGLDGSAQQSIPYSVSESRYQVRLIPSADASCPVVFASSLETRDYHYERITQDPQCSQTVLLAQDAFGSVLHSVSINYPRRTKPAASPYPATLPATLFASSYDEQQQLLRLTQQQASWHHLTEGENWHLGLPYQQRSNLFTYPASNVPTKGLSLESLLAADSLIANSKPCIFGGQQQVWYTDGPAKNSQVLPTAQALVAFTDSAVLDDVSLSAYDGVLSAAELNSKLQSAGYRSSARLFNRGTETAVWCVRQGLTDHGTATQFWQPQAQWNTELTGKTQFSWDTHFCVMTKIVDAAGFVIQASYDYRFLAPTRLTDLNDNQHFAQMDAVGRVTSVRSWGTEAGKTAGYATPETQPFTQPANIDAALALGKGIPVAQCLVYVPDSWMQVISASQLNAQMKDNGVLWQSLLAAHAVTEDERVCALGYQRWAQSHTVPAALQTLLDSASRQPPHGLTITTDRYDSDPAQQLRQQILFSDGFGRALQTAVRHENGMAWQRSSSGSLVVANGVPAETSSDNRWVVSGRSEYDNKGLLIRSYQPYFLNDWRYVSDDSARLEMYADSHYYDPLDREYTVITAKGYQRHIHYYPWFVVSEDENDTAAE
ncbi:SpvB/TcaC N-terminal domain-containing protein [Ewingella americana]|uniref:Virulence protein n=1 Tax=Ewingella americana TaxID=41202 RepID=A0A502GJ17_9GAMM|nr:SpvB/TcaC N-terminal domain-containing protein [Ewingella americana]TPG61558.1 virulence protein [Ewingella americana]